MVESRLENHRIHKVLVYYFLEDKSIMIIEPKIENSGVPQGAFLKRQVVIKPNGAPFYPEDFGIGIDVGIFGRTFRIVDCDEYTRQFFRVSSSISDLNSNPLFTYAFQIDTVLCFSVCSLTWEESCHQAMPLLRTTSPSPRSRSHQRRTVR